ncbi:hypothetical protein [Thermus sp.]|uniref:hypothetical protein n=1 Tax=Thermus sp. TaxID=275 RepID=UPI003D0F03E4
MATALSRDISRDILRGVLPFSLTPLPARPPLALAYGVEEVPPWDWTRGFDPWRTLPLGKPYLSPLQRGERLPFPRPLSPRLLLEHALGEVAFGPEVERAFLTHVAPPWGAWDAPPEGLGGKPAPPMTFPRLVRAHALNEPIPPLDQPLYLHVGRLGAVAKGYPPTSPRFARAALTVARKVGLLDPWGVGDSLPGWHAFALEVRGYLDALREGDFFLDDLRERIGFRFDSELGGWVYRGRREAWDGAHAYFAALNVVQASGGREEVAHYLLNRALPGLFARVESRGVGSPLQAKVSVRDWVFLELAHLFAHKGVSFCPVCGTAFLGRKGQRTCGAEACRKAFYRKSRKSHEEGGG